MGNLKRVQRDLELQSLVDEFGELLLEMSSKGRFTYANVRVTELLGYTPEEFLQLDPRRLSHPEDLNETNALYARLISGQTDSGTRTHRVLRKDGSYLWLQDAARAFVTEDGERRIVVHGRDITAHREAEIALEQQLEEQRVIAGLSRKFLGIDAREINASVQEELVSMGELAGCESLLFLYLDRQRAKPPRPFLWRAEHLDLSVPEPNLEGFTWAGGRLRDGEILNFPKVADFPSEAAAERRHLQELGVRSLLCIPVLSGGSLIALQIFACMNHETTWSEHKIRALSLLGEIFATAIGRGDSENAQRQSEERFRTIAEQATELVAEFDSIGRYCYVSPSYETLLGYTPESLIGQPATKLIHPDDQKGARRRFRRAFERSVESNSIHRLLRSDGVWRWYENSGQSYECADGQRHFVSIGHDITERFEAQARLESQLELERTAAELSARLLGLRGQELGAEIKRSLEETARKTGAERAYLGTFPSGREDPGAFFEWCGALTGPQPSATRKWSIRMLKQGEIIHIPDVDVSDPATELLRRTSRERGVQAILAIPIRSGDVTVGAIGFESSECRAWLPDEITLLCLIGEILTSALQRQAADIALIESQHQLAQSQKIEAVGRLAGGIAHDFNNLLTVILGLSRPILRDLQPGSEMYDDMRDIHDAAERAAALTSQLLTFSRRQPVQDQNVLLNETLDNLRPLLSRMLGEDIELDLDLCDESAEVRGDPHQYEQIIVNLASNARDAMPDGGTLRFGTAILRADAGTKPLMQLSPDERHMVLTATDTGDGMDEETLQRIFDPFFTTKEPGKGTGLGLSIVYSVVEQSNGGIDVESAVDKGTTFAIWLPISVEESSIDEEQGSDRKTQGDERVLIAEDEPAVRRLTRRILEQAGHTVVEADDGEHALSLFIDDDIGFDAVVSDVVMPRMGGAELAEKLREIRPDLPVLFISGHPEDRGRPLDFADAALLQKPFTADSLIRGLRQLIDG